MTVYALIPRPDSAPATKAPARRRKARRGPARVVKGTTRARATSSSVGSRIVGMLRANGYAAGFSRLADGTVNITTNAPEAICLAAAKAAGA